MNWKYIHHYLPLNPIKQPEDYAAGTIISSIECNTDNGCKFSLKLQGSKNRIDVIIATGLYEEREKTSVFINHAIEHMLTVLKLDYSPDADVAWSDDGFMSMVARSDNENQLFDPFKTVNPPPINEFDLNNINMLFAETVDPKQADVLALLAESIVPNVPNHYKFLSLYRAMELLTPNIKLREAILDKYQEDFVTINTGAIPLFRKAIPAIRDRCAHGRLDKKLSRQPERGDKNYPIVGIGYNHNVNLYALLTLFRRVVADTIKDEFGTNITANPKADKRPVESPPPLNPGGWLQFR
ncbi:hypothetical protein [Methylobacterium sp. 10]|uniref:hypothetical protein n=1 Tax=Methylobacterium sp. 10 TaxID=1101191 RepID=UPI0012DD35E7|nr:hypothetical protein [Methylobacterium sp. 10]